LLEQIPTPRNEVQGCTSSSEFEGSRPSESRARPGQHHDLTSQATVSAPPRC
jgi:hypothetical protein